LKKKDLTDLQSQELFKNVEDYQALEDMLDTGGKPEKRPQSTQSGRSVSATRSKRKMVVAIVANQLQNRSKSPKDDPTGEINNITRLRKAYGYSFANSSNANMSGKTSTEMSQQNPL
jgi:hypothetical protein